MLPEKVLSRIKKGFIIFVTQFFFRKIQNYHLGDKSEFGVPSIHKLMEALDSWIDLPSRDVNSPILMPIDKILSITGRGTVAVGTIKQGKMAKDKPVQVKI